MASEATNELDQSRDSNALHETEKKQQESSPREEQVRRNLISKINVIARDPKKGLQMDLDNARKKRNRAGNAVKKQIEFEDDLLRQSKDIIALKAGLARSTNENGFPKVLTRNNS